MFDISLSVANFVFGLANTILIIGAILVAVGTIAAIWAGGIRERFADERISANEAKTATAVADAARANESAEKLRESNLTLQAAADHERAARLKLEQKIAPRRLSDQQKEMLIAALKPFHGQRVDVVCILGDTEGKQFAQDFDTVFRQAGWNDGGGSGISQAVITPDPKGIEVTLNQGEVSAGRIPKSAEVLVDTLAAAGLLNAKNAFVNAEAPADRITFRVGRKPD